MMKPLKVNKAFIHMPRTGGTSLRIGLQRAESSEANKVQELDYGDVINYGKKYFIGHFPYGYIEDASYFTILRDPMARMQSEYSYFGESSRDDIINSRYADFDNIYVRYLTGLRIGGGELKERNVNENDFLKACENLKKISFTFFEYQDEVEKLHNEFFRFNRRLGWENRTEQHLAMDNHLTYSVIENNKYDLNLYCYAKELKENLNG